MSAETSNWLNNNVLVGFTAKRGHAWHYLESAQGAEPNHYEGAIPVDDVMRRLFNFEFVEAPVCYLVPCGIAEAQVVGDDGGNYNIVMSSVGRKGMLTSDSHEDLGSFKSGYVGHAYKEWLIDHVANIVDSDLAIGSAALLRNRAVAFVQIEMPENVTTKEGFTFRPWLGATTSFDGTVATTYKRGITVWVCDNTMAAGLSENGEQLKFKHTKHSKIKLANARDALGVVHSMADDFSAEVTRLAEMEVTRKQFVDILHNVIPMGDDPSKNKVTVTERVWGDITSLYFTDSRVTDWNGTGLGVVQAFNTYNHHVSQTRGRSRVEKNLDAKVTGVFAEKDDEVIAVMEKVLANA